MCVCDWMRSRAPTYLRTVHIISQMKVTLTILDLKGRGVGGKREEVMKGGGELQQVPSATCQEISIKKALS